MKRITFVLLSAVMTVFCNLSAVGAAQVSAEGRPDQPDILIIGSELEGMYLARAAADAGQSVQVIDPRPKPGGQLLEGEMLFLDEPLGDGGEVLLQGKVKSLFDAYKRGTIRKAEQFRNYYSELTKGIAIESGVTLTGIDVRQQPDATGRFVESVSYRTQNGQERTVYPGYVVENTDYAALTSQLGLSRIPGMETVFGPPDADSPDYMAATLIMKFKNVDWGVFQQEVMKLGKQERELKYGSETTVNPTFTWGFGKVGAGYDSGTDHWFLRGLNTVNQHDGEVLINALLVYGIDPSDEAAIRTAMAEGREQTDRILPYLRQALPGWSKAEINGYPDYLYIRDYDRYETEYVLQGTDLMSGRMFWDNVSIGGYEIDLQGTMSSKWGSRRGNPDKYGMPLRAFLAKGYINVIVAGKNVGASAVAYGSARIQAQTALAAETIGLMLGRIDGKYRLTDITPAQMSELQTWVRAQHGITLTGVQAVNKLGGLSEAQKQSFDQGKLVIP